MDFFGKEMIYSNLPIYKSALDMSVYVETIVKSFDKYQKYTIGTDMRNMSKDILFMIHKANISNSYRLKQKLLNKERKDYEKIIFSTTNSY
jgi:hypothetical protein